MSDTAKGPITGYLFQFEKALLMLTSLDNDDDFISIEDVDDIALHKENGTVLITIQAKNSISTSGTTFEDTSIALWRTIQIWINKLEINIFNNNTSFTCTTNKVIPDTSLLYKIKTLLFDDLMLEIVTLLKQQQEKAINIKKINPKKGNSIEKINKIIEEVISKKEIFKIIKNNIVINDNLYAKEMFLNKLYLSNERYSESKKNEIFESFFGWLIENSSSKWKNGEEARIYKKNFNEKHFQVFHNPSIINAIFRTKESLGIVNDKEIQEKRRELFVKQIEDINRRKEAKERIIKNAILDYIYSDIELTHIITKGDFTEVDFNKFLEQCIVSWQSCVDEIITKEIEDYSDEHKNLLAIEIFDRIMNKIEIKFQSGYSFNTNNQYMRNGCFLKLSNLPKIGWHPEWENKYLKTNV